MILSGARRGWGGGGGGGDYVVEHGGGDQIKTQTAGVLIVKQGYVEASSGGGNTPEVCE